MILIRKAIELIILASLICSCTDSILILKNQDFDNGVWLLVNADYGHYDKRVVYVIDDIKILKANPDGIKVNYTESDMYTTCDGVIKLYKNGILILQQNYLVSNRLKVSDRLKKAFKKASESTINVINKQDFQGKWDSLKNIPKCYPTIYHIQPENKDIIWYYKYE
jgi:hypothetical protein